MENDAQNKTALNLWNTSLQVYINFDSTHECNEIYCCLCLFPLHSHSMYNHAVVNVHYIKLKCKDAINTSILYKQVQIIFSKMLFDEMLLFQNEIRFHFWGVMQ